MIQTKNTVQRRRRGPKRRSNEMTQVLTRMTARLKLKPRVLSLLREPLVNFQDRKTTNPSAHLTTNTFVLLTVTVGVLTDRQTENVTLKIHTVRHQKKKNLVQRKSRRMMRVRAPNLRPKIKSKSHHLIREAIYMLKETPQTLLRQL